jgi:predicted dehydrogenase
MITAFLPLRIGVIGCGHWGPNHIRTFSQMKDCTVTAIADANAKRLASGCEMFPHVRGFADHTALLRDGGVDAVVVVTPTRTHFAVVTEALNAGKHGLCEKPPCIDTAVRTNLDPARSNMADRMVVSRRKRISQPWQTT